MTSSIVWCFSFNSLFPSQVSCQDLPTNKKKQTGHCHPDYKGKRCELVSNILLLPHGGRWANIYYIWSFVLLSATAKPRGWNSKLPAYSCKSIRDSGDSKGDGRYWIDPENSGNPVERLLRHDNWRRWEICSKKNLKSWAIIAHSNYFSVSDWTIFPGLFFINSYHYQI